MQNWAKFPSLIYSFQFISHLPITSLSQGSSQRNWKQYKSFFKKVTILKTKNQILQPQNQKPTNNSVFGQSGPSWEGNSRATAKKALLPSSHQLSLSQWWRPWLDDWMVHAEICILLLDVGGYWLDCTSMNVLCGKNCILLWPPLVLFWYKTGSSPVTSMRPNLWPCSD